MSLEFEINLEELDTLQEYIDQLEKKIDLEDFEVQSSLLEKLQAVLFEDLQKRFASAPPVTLGGVVYGGATWNALSDSYLRSRPDRLNGRIYIDTGALKNSLVSLTPDTISSFESSTEFKFGTRIPYAEKLQKLRQIIYWHPELLQKIAEVYLNFLVENKE